MKLFRTSSIDVINDCRTNFSFMLPSEMIAYKKGTYPNFRQRPMSDIT